jgi:hypothetical protein
VTPRLAAAVAAVGVLASGACGTTYIDSSVTVPGTGVTTTTTLAPVPPDAPLDSLLDEIEGLMLHLDEQIVDRDHPAATMARIDELWDVAEAQIRDRDPDDLFPFEQAIDLARSGVERNRPADASKGYKVLIAAIAAYPVTG